MVAWRDLGHPEAGGSEVHAASVAERWASAGIDVTLKVSRAPEADRSASVGGVQVLRPARRYSIFPATFLDGLSRPRGKRPDGVIEVWNGLPFLSPLWAGGARAVWLHHVHDGMWDLTLPAPLARVGRHVELHLAPRFYRNTRVVTLSESSRRTIVRLMGLDPSWVEVVEPGVDPCFRPGRQRSRRPLFVVVGRLMPYKRVDRLVDALVRVHERHPDVEAVIVGTGPEREVLRAQIEGHGASSWLTLAGRLTADELVALYQRAWAVLSASAYEGWGLTLTEAAACGTPAIASRIPGHLDAVREGSSGLLFDGGDELVAAASALVEQPHLLRRLQAGARARADELSWDKTAYGTLRSLAADALERKERSVSR